ncbi:hypothetical protein CLAIMM_07082 [Cladophialophora immunda]|nr:hypothetical protein CLAIMM_07082 [Cladophialophora immunda]
MRLVCRDWAEIGADFLFSTAYLNSYEKSWAGLLNICDSSHARRVRRIVWNPLVLYEECLDGPTWSLRYPNLIKGLKQSEIFRLHQEYAKVYQARRGQLRSSEIRSVSEALQKLSSCHECVISDDYDLETICLDPYLRMRIQGDPDLLRRAANWGLRPRWWLENGEIRDILRTGVELFKLVQNCAAIERLSVNYWDENWTNMVAEDTRLGGLEGYKIDRTSNPNIQSITLHLKYCRGNWLPFDRWDVRTNFQFTFGGLFSFPELRELSFEPAYTDPGLGFMEFVNALKRAEETDSESPEDNDEAIDSPRESQRGYKTLSDLEEAYSRPDGFTLDMMCSLIAQLDLGLVKLSKLTKLSLTNVTLDVRCLLLWLCEQEQLPLSGLSIHLQGTTFLFDLDQETIFYALAQLNVNLAYIPENTFHYLPSPDARFAEPYYGANTLECVTPFSSVRNLCWSMYDIHELVRRGLPAQMPAFPLSGGKVTPGPVEIKRRPSKFWSIQRSYQHREPDVQLFHYCMPGPEGGICDWLDERIYRTELPRALSLLMFNPFWDRDPNPSAGYFGEEVEHEILVHTTELDQETTEPKEQEQQLVLQYEAELLGLDILEQLDLLN